MSAAVLVLAEERSGSGGTTEPVAVAVGAAPSPTDPPRTEEHR